MTDLSPELLFLENIKRAKKENTIQNIA